MRSSRRWQPGFSVCGSISPKAGSSVTSTGLPRGGGKAFQMHIPISELLNSSGGKGPGGPQTFKPIEGSVCSVVSHSATPWTVARQAPLSSGIFQARTLLPTEAGETLLCGSRKNPRGAPPCQDSGYHILAKHTCTCPLSGSDECKVS